MSLRSVTLAVILAFVLALGGGVLAQGVLSDEDQALYDAAFSNLPTSTNFEASILQDIVVDGEEISQTFTASGGYVFDSAAAAELAAGLDPAAFADPTAIDPTVIADTLKRALAVAD
ncbi:MAG: hypothetical protein AAF125_04450, partial [Chloroflexota bacterium]